MDILINLLIIILLALPVYLYFFWNERFTAIHFTIVVNAVTFSIGNLLVTKAGIHYYPVQVGIFMLQAVIIYFFWQVSLRKAFLISLIANALSFLFFEVANHYSLHF